MKKIETYKGHDIFKKGKMYETKYLEFGCSDLGMIKILIKNKSDNKNEPIFKLK